jgi:hypothetical protein
MTKNRSNYNATNDFLNAVLGIDLLVYETDILTPSTTV